MCKSNHFRSFLIPLTAIILLASGCIKQDFSDNPQPTQPVAPKLFDTGVTIPDDFRWSSVKTVDVRVVVDDKFGGQYFYSIELFDSDPVFGTGANLLGAGQAKQGQDFVCKITVPTGLQYIYIRQTSPVGIRSLTMVSVADVNTITVSKANGAGAFRENAGLAVSGTTAEPAVPADAIEISGNGNYSVESNKSYVVRPGGHFIGEINANNGTSGARIFVQGTWKNRNFTLNLGNTNAIIVSSSGTLDLTNVIQNTSGAFANYGTTILENLSTSNAALYSNYGVLTAKRATFANGSFTNYAGGTVSIETLTSTTGATTIRNEGRMDVRDANLTNATLEAACYTTIENLYATNAAVNVNSSALLSIKKVEAGGTRFNLASAAILDIWVSAKFNTNRNYLTGTGSGKALARLKKVDVENQWQAITYSGQLEVACSDHTSNGQWSIFYILNSPATIVAYDRSTVRITGSACNAGGNNDTVIVTPPNPPADQTVSEINMGTYSYAFEDNWPDTGDYDMNDFVVDVSITKYQNASNKVTKVALNGKLRSVGASKRMSAAVQLDGVAASNVRSVSYSRTDLTGSNLKLASNGVESGQTYAVATIADDAHRAFGVSDTRFISTQNGGYSPVDVTITIEFNTPLENFTYNALNVFIVNVTQSADSRGEVHMVGYAGTDKVSRSLIDKAKGTKVSYADSFKSIHSEPWGLCMPISFVFPVESKNIKDMYPKFEGWAVSGGTKDTNWYLEHK